MSVFMLGTLAAGLSMDAFAVSVTNGLADTSGRRRSALVTALAFGFFQALMPFIGFFAGGLFGEFIRKWDHVAALVLLGFIGGKMLWDGIMELRAGGVEAATSGAARLTFPVLLAQAAATSIDALVVGVSFAAFGLGVGETFFACAFIGGVTALLCFLGWGAGRRFGATLGGRAKLLGGAVLTLIGLKIFLEHILGG